MSMIDKFKSKTLKHSLKDVYDYLGAMEKALNGDMVLVLSPATTGSSAATVNAAIGGSNAKYTRKVTVSVKTAAGEVCSFINGTFAIAATKTSTNGVIAISGSATTVTISEGIGTVTLEYTGTWVAADTQTLTITGGTKLGYTIANKTSIDTLIA
ncbi:MAG: hypothetical protein K0R54_2140 [Clostridiaceae bacterium]|nr:hypothetical protein [Clostridiaceae bacterium]